MKQLLAKFLPASARAFHSISAQQSKLLGKILFAIKQLLANISKQNYKLDKMQKSVKSAEKSLSTKINEKFESYYKKQIKYFKDFQQKLSTENKILFDNQSQKFETLESTVINLEKQILEQKKLIEKLEKQQKPKKNPKQATSYTTNPGSTPFYEYMEQPIFEERLINLLTNLDDFGKNQVILCMKRVQAAKSASLEGKTKFVYERTKEEMQFLQEIKQIESQVVNLAEDRLLFGEYILPKSFYFAGEFTCFPYHLKRIKNPTNLLGKTIIDAGAAKGDTAIRLLETGCETVHSFEPISTQFKELQKTIQYNNLNVIAIKKALGKQQETVTFLSKAGQSRKLDDLSENLQMSTEEVEIITLDDYVKENNLQIGLIKADIEGSEQDMLAGAKQTIIEQKPVLMICIYHSIDDFFSIKPLIESWNLGYSFTVVKSSTKNNAPVAEMLLIAEYIPPVEKVAKVDKQMQKLNNLTTIVQDVKKSTTSTYKKIGNVESLIKNLSYFKDYDYYKNLKPSQYRRALEDWYETHTNNKLNFDNPQRYTEKIQWLKLYDSTPLKTKLADKYAVREWIAEKIGEEYLVPLLGVYENFDEINFDTLPKKFILKCNHGCQMNLIVEDKDLINHKVVRQKFERYLNTNYAFYGLELHYKDIPPKIIAEKYINETNDWTEYHFFCANGKIDYFYVDSFNDARQRDFFDINWNLQPFTQRFPNSEIPPKRPNNFDEMLKIATILCQEFIHVRIDLYNSSGKIYFGEMTFTSGNGRQKYEPDNIDYKLGNLIELPKIPKI
ncbi:MAG: FkbM family methyltransferase [Firmicutes bacterium]|nr:FkbM family methyltransferase [Bacillota bacterium]